MAQPSQFYENPNIWDQDLQLYQKHLVQAYIDHWPDGIASVLDVGCGDGKIIEALSKNFDNASFHGYDHSTEALKRLKIPYTQGDATNLPFKDRSFDLVMSVDMLEHLDDKEEEQAWQELFRVANKWVFVTVPFIENLEEATAKCENCGFLYHVNWHKRSYDTYNLLKKAVTGWSVAGIVLSGVEWSSLLPPEISFRRQNLNEWNDWEAAECPACHAKGKSPDPLQSLSSKAAGSLAKKIYSKSEKNPFTRSHSEIIIAFSRFEESLIRKSGTLAKKISRPAALIDFNHDCILVNLEPFPQTAKLVKANDGGLIAQFPLYPESIKGNIFKINWKTNSDYLGLDTQAELIIEDNNGQVKYSFSDDKTILKPKRILEAGYYGIIVRLPANHLFESIELINSPVRNFYEPLNPKRISYYNITPNLSIQIPKVMNCNILGIKSLHNKKILMICHDQNIDRRILSQAQALIGLGAKVTLVAFSTTQEDLDEIITEGLHLKRIGLKNIIPQNPVYIAYIKRIHQINNLITKARGKAKALSIPGIFNKIKRTGLKNIIPQNPVYTSYIKRGHQINNLITKFRGAGNLLFRMLAKINWNIYLFHLFITYRNTKSHDPLPFFSAFFNKCASIPCDLIQVHDLPALEAGVKLAKQLNVPIVYDAHELYPEQIAFSKIQRKVCHNQEMRLIKEVDHVLTVNESIADIMSKRYNISTPTTILNAIETPQNKVIESDLLYEKLSLSKQRRLLLFQGGLSPHRNLEKLVKTFCYVKLQNVDLVLLGSGNLKGKLVSLANRYGLLNKRVYFIEAVAQDELLAYTASATMGIIPYPHVDLNSYYCTPNKLFEFIQAKLPIIANDSPELRRFVTQEGFGINVMMKSSKDIAKAIDKAFSSGDFELWKTNLNQKSGLFSWEVEKPKYIKVVAELLHN